MKSRSHSRNRAKPQSTKRIRSCGTLKPMNCTRIRTRKVTSSCTTRESWMLRPSKLIPTDTCERHTHRKGKDTGINFFPTWRLFFESRTSPSAQIGLWTLSLPSSAVLLHLSPRSIFPTSQRFSTYVMSVA